MTQHKDQFSFICGSVNSLVICSGGKVTSSGAIKVRLQCASHSLPGSGLPWSAGNICSTIRLSNLTLNLCSYHLAYASSILMYVVMFDPGECVYVSLASPLYTFLLYPKAREKNSLCIGCFMQEE